MDMPRLDSLVLTHIWARMRHSGFSVPCVQYSVFTIYHFQTRQQTTATLPCGGILLCVNIKTLQPSSLKKHKVKKKRKRKPLELCRRSHFVLTGRREREDESQPLREVTIQVQMCGKQWLILI